jgi:hypothetical protein
VRIFSLKEYPGTSTEILKFASVSNRRINSALAWNRIPVTLPTVICQTRMWPTCLKSWRIKHVTLSSVALDIPESCHRGRFVSPVGGSNVTAFMWWRCVIITIVNGDSYPWRWEHSGGRITNSAARARIHTHTRTHMVFRTFPTSGPAESSTNVRRWRNGLQL